MNLNRSDTVNQIIYKCLNDNCSCEFKGKNTDGFRCPKCKSSIVPFNINSTDEELAKTLTYKELKNKTMSMVNKKLWKEFRDRLFLFCNFAERSINMSDTIKEITIKIGANIAHLADELNKYFELLSKGAITKEEFENIKKELLKESKD